MADDLVKGTLTVLGSGTSMGVPIPGCRCATCTSSDPRDNRLRPSIAVGWGDRDASGEPAHRVIIDTGPEFRIQALRAGIRQVDAVFYTHSHADHILGLDDLRPLSFLRKGRELGKLPLYADDATAVVLERIFDYTFSPSSTYPNKARVALHRIAGAESVEVGGVRFQRIPLKHGRLDIAGYRFGNAAYLTDMSEVPEASLHLLEGLDVLILDALRLEAHPAHANVAQALGWIKKIQPRQAFFTHMSHELKHEETERSLPSHVRLAYDGMELPVALQGSGRLTLAAAADGGAVAAQSGPSGTGGVARTSSQASRAEAANATGPRMKIFRSLAEVPAGYGPSVIAIGNFDGVHRGHLSILRDVCARARALNAQALAVTFDPHPLQLLYPERAPKLITPLAQRLELLAEVGAEGHGLDATLVLPFTREFSEYSAEGFANDVLARALGAVEVHEGDNFRFGYGARAGMAELRALGEQFGFGAFTHPVLTVRGMAAASSQVRALVAAGNVSQARALLGRPFAIRSTQARGRGIGTRLLVPTVNLAPYAELVPAHGVYITQLRIGDPAAEEVGGAGGLPRSPASCFNAVTNAGNRPTFGEDSYAIESYLLDYDPANPPVLTPETPLELSFLARLRGEQRFSSPEALKVQILRDVERAQRYFRLAGSLVFHRLD